MEEHNQPLPCLIAGEPALLDALEMVDEIIDQHINPHLWVLDESIKVDDLKTLRATMQKAIDAMRSEAEERHHDDGPADDEDPYAGDAEGEMRAEAEAERIADAMMELAAERAYGWDDLSGWY